MIPLQVSFAGNSVPWSLTSSDGTADGSHGSTMFAWVLMPRLRFVDLGGSALGAAGRGVASGLKAQWTQTLCRSSAAVGR